MRWLLLLPGLSASGAFGLSGDAQPPSYTDMNSVQALRNLEGLTERPTKGLSDTELSEWVRARFARIALLRLEGRPAEALVVFEGCAKLCEKHGPTEEWKALKAWGCGKKAKSDPCR